MNEMHKATIDYGRGTKGAASMQTMRGVRCIGPSLVGAPSLCPECSQHFNVAADADLRALVPKSALFTGALVRKVGIASASIRFGMATVAEAAANYGLFVDGRIPSDVRPSTFACSDPFRHADYLASRLPRQSRAQTVAARFHACNCTYCGEAGFSFIRIEILVERWAPFADASEQGLRPDELSGDARDELRSRLDRHKLASRRYSDDGPAQTHQGGPTGRGDDGS